jgi:hypothetical protein
MTAYKSFARTRLKASARNPETPPPETIVEFIETSLANPPRPPKHPPVPKRPPARPAGIWADMSPEERSAHAKKLAAMRRPENMARPYKRKRGPKGWAVEDANAAKAKALILAEEMVSRLVKQGAIAPGDTEGARATVHALAKLNTPGGHQREKLRAAKRLVAHYGPKVLEGSR